MSSVACYTNIKFKNVLGCKDKGLSSFAVDKVVL